MTTGSISGKLLSRQPAAFRELRELGGASQIIVGFALRGRYAPALLDDRMSTATNGANQPRVSEVGVSPRAKVLLFAAVAIIVIITVARTCIWWRADAGISFASGVMITMALM